MLRRRRLVWGSTRLPPVNVTFPESCGAASDPRAAASTRSCPRSWAVRSARNGSASSSGMVPFTLASSPGPDSGMRPEPWMSRPRAAVTRAELSCTAPRAKLAGRHDGERRKRIVRQHPGADALAAEIEADGGGRERPAHPAPAGKGAAESAVPGDPVDEREGEGLQVEGDVEIAGAGAERNRAPGPSREFPAALTRASRLSRRFDVCPRAWTPTGGRPAARVVAPSTPAAVTSKRTSGASRGPVTRAVPFTVPARPKVRPDRIREPERHVAHRELEIEGIGDAALRRQAAGAEVEPQRRQLDGAVADADRGRCRQRRGRGLVAKPERAKRRRETAVEAGELARDVGQGADREPAFGAEAHPVGGRAASRSR